MSLSFTFVDLLVVGTIIVSAIYAGYRGLVAETLSIFAWAAAAFATLWFGPAVVPAARGIVASPLLAMLAAYAIVFLAVLIPLSFLSFRFSQQVKNSQGGTLDLTLGAAFGIVRGFAIIGFAYLILDSFVKYAGQPDAVKNARTLPLMQASTEVILSLVPPRPDLGDRKSPEPTKVTDDNTGYFDAEPYRDILPAPKPGSRRVVEETNLAPMQSAPAPKSTKKPQKTYGAADRHALDTLIETTGGNPKP